MRLHITLSGIIIFILTFLFLGLIGCSGNGTPTTPEYDADDNGDLREPAVAENRYLWGLWTVKIDPETQTYEIIPKREAEFHVEVRYFLEKKPCSNCIFFENIYFYPNDKVKILVRITHPFDDPFLDGFDVRAVVILKSTINFANFRLSNGVLEELYFPVQLF